MKNNKITYKGEERKKNMLSLREGWFDWVRVGCYVTGKSVQRYTVNWGDQQPS